MKNTITTDQVRQILEKAKAESMVEIPEGAALTAYFMERSTNHGVLQLFYRMMLEILNYEADAKKEGKHYERMAG